MADETDSGVAIDLDEDYEERKERLIEDAKSTRQELEQEQSAMLEAVAEGEDFEIESYEWVELGGVQLQVKAWFPGDTLEEIAGMAEVAETRDPSAARAGIRTNINALTEMTEVIEGGDRRFQSDERIRMFWNNYFEKWGDQGLEKAVETVIEPAEENSDREDTMKSFPKPGRSRADRARHHRNG